MLESLQITDVRNLSSLDIPLGSGLNLFVGPNGAGKTAILEAVHLLARGRSFRAPQASKVIRHDQPEAIVRAVLRPADGVPRTLAVLRPRRGALKIHIDGENVAGISAISRSLAVQVMLPGVSDLVFGGPSERRRWLDWGVFHVEPSYLATWRRYTKALKQRNALLKQQASPDSAVFQTFNRALIDAAAPLNTARQAYIRRWVPWFQRTISALDDELAQVEQQIRPYGGSEGAQTTESFEDLLSESLPRDVKLGVTHRGPHRLELGLFLDGYPVSEKLSRGQGKTLALAMMMSQSELLAHETGQKTLFLIDDAGAELDQVHNAAFFEALADTGAQVLATCTQQPWTGPAYSGEKRTVFHVKQGQIDVPTDVERS